MELDLIMVKQSDAIVFLPGSDKSEGAQVEAAYARQLGLKEEQDLLNSIWYILQKMYVLNVESV